MSGDILVSPVYPAGPVSPGEWVRWRWCEARRLRGRGNCGMANLGIPDAGLLHLWADLAVLLHIPYTLSASTFASSGRLVFASFF
jgi:hypothetical protein